MSGAKNIDEGVVHSKLDAIRRAIKTLSGVSPLDASTLTSDPIIAAAVERLVCRIVELAVEINSHIAAAVLARAPRDYRESYELACESGAISPDLAAKLRPSVGLRNTIVHEYVPINYEIVARAVPMATQGYTEYCAQIAKFLLEHTDNST